MTCPICSKSLPCFHPPGAQHEPLLSRLERWALRHFRRRAIRVLAEQRRV